MRRYDAEHLARHPKQKVAAMKLLVSADIPEGEKQLVYSFHLSVKYRRRAGDFDSSGYCNHAIAEDEANEIRFACGVDCEGGGINVALSKDGKSAIVRLERIVVWQTSLTTTAKRRWPAPPTRSSTSTAWTRRNAPLS